MIFVDEAGPASTKEIASWPAHSPSYDQKNNIQSDRFTTPQPVSTFPSAQRIAKAYASYFAPDAASPKFESIAATYSTLCANFSTAGTSTTTSVKDGHGHERSWTTRLAWLLGHRDFSGDLGVPVHQTTVGSGSTASDIVFLDWEGLHMWNIEAKTSGANAAGPLLLASHAEVMNQARRLPTLARDWMELCKKKDVKEDTGLYPFLLSYWSPEVLIVTLCIPCYG